MRGEAGEGNTILSCRRDSNLEAAYGPKCEHWRCLLLRSGDIPHDRVWRHHARLQHRQGLLHSVHSTISGGTADSGDYLRLVNALHDPRAGHRIYHSTVQRATPQQAVHMATMLSF